ncbi:MAG: ABC transporter permease [Anaerolineaceae bacterium]|nr:ABC transporter permease [Anaerolineaceae bacterium]
MKAFINHFSFEFRAGIRNKQLLLMNYLFPLGMYFLLGMIMTQIDPTFKENLIPVMVTISILAATLLGIPDPLVNARENGIFRSYKINGIPALSILAIPALTTIVHLIIVASIITATAPLLFGAPLPANWFNFIITFFGMAFACSGISILIGVISKTSRITILWSQLIFVPSMLLGGLMLPFDFLPPFIGQIGLLLPTPHAMNSFTGLSIGETLPAWGSLLVLFTSGLLAFTLAYFLFSWDSRNSKKEGRNLLGLLVLLPNIISILLFI